MAGIEQLPARQRQALLLRELAGLSYTQLAAALETSEAAAEALLVRARRRLRRGGLILLPLPFPFSLPRSLQRPLRLLAGRTARACTCVGGQATAAAAAATLLPLAALVATGTPAARATQAAALAPATAVRARAGDSRAERATRPSAHTAVATPVGGRQRFGIETTAAAASETGAATPAAAGPDGLRFDSSEGSQPAAAIGNPPSQHRHPIPH